MITPGRRAAGVVLTTSALGAAQSAAIVTQIGAVGDAVGGTIFAAGPTAQLVLALLSAVFVAVALTVTCVAVTGATEVVLTGQVRDIALRRLLGATAHDVRDRIGRAVLRRALLGMAAGAVLGHVVSIGILAATVAPSDQLHLSAASYLPSPLLLLALAGQYAATAAAVRRGTRGVLVVPPVEALRQAADADRVVTRTLAVSRRAAFGTLLAGLALLAATVLAARTTPLAMVPAVAGGIVTFVGVVSYAPRFVPRVVAGLCAVLPRTPGLVDARRSLLSHPQRGSRAVLGVAAPVVVVTTFAVGIASFDRAVAEHYSGSAVAGLAGDIRGTLVTVMLTLAGSLGLTAVVALANAAGFEAWARRRETALRRVLGQSARRTRAGVVAHSALVGLTATVVGLALGVGFGWVGAQSVVGAEVPGGVVVPVVPTTLLVGAVAAVGAVTVAAAVAPIRAALRLPPIRAYLAP